MDNGPVIHSFENGCGCSLGQGMGSCSGGSSIYSSCDKCRSLQSDSSKIVDAFSQLNVMMEQRRRDNG